MNIIDWFLDLFGIGGDTEKKAAKKEAKALKMMKQARDKNRLAIATEKEAKAKKSLDKAKARLAKAKSETGGIDLIGDIDKLI